MQNLIVIRPRKGRKKRPNSGEVSVSSHPRFFHDGLACRAPLIDADRALEAFDSRVILDSNRAGYDAFSVHDVVGLDVSFSHEAPGRRTSLLQPFAFLENQLGSPVHS
jgi:hypothetical protein